MPEMRIDVLKDQNAKLVAVIKLMLTTTGNVNGRAIAESLIADTKEGVRHDV